MSKFFIAPDLAYDRLRQEAEDARKEAKDWMTKYSVTRDALATAEAGETATRHSYEALLIAHNRLRDQNDKLTAGLVLALELAKQQKEEIL